MEATLPFKLRLSKGIIKIYDKRPSFYLFVYSHHEKLSLNTKINAVELQKWISLSGTDEQTLATFLGETASLLCLPEE